MKDYKDEVKWAWQRIFRKWDDTVVWSIDEHLSIVLPQILRQLKKEASSYPQNVKNLKDWKEILEQIANAFEAYWLMRNATFNDTKSFKKQQVILKKKFDKGFQLFVKHFSGLWN